MNQSTTIITAYFDIGRGEWNSSHGYSDRLERTTDTYFDYFSKLAKLDNKMIVFTSSNFKEKVLEIRKGKPTHVITIDIHKKFKYITKKIASIQNSEQFKKLIKPEQQKNPEYWSSEYVLVTNLKAYFVNKAITLGLVDNERIAWVDFGYIRKEKTLNGLTEWNHPFDRKKIHFFSIKEGLDLTNEAEVMKRVIDNDTYVIGGVIVGTKEKWARLYQLAITVQKNLLLSSVIDDDQGIFLICANKEPNLVKLHYLGNMEWFNVFKLFHKGSKVNNLIRLAILLKLVK
ncbi:protein YibB [Providencia rustigianii]|uniref:protein YibB n=1 Tax=Providencia rustigianii TaxID=158850 RepID=UPI000F6F2C9C|nr:protein YibB [Providencia rustigianii]MTC59522.1 protein YibB [Providencia rustigianii]VEH57148.1 protein YibB [Providencia rustigianii]